MNDDEFSANRQQAHFEHIHNDYVDGYEDEHSMRYKQKIIFPIIIKSLNNLTTQTGSVLEIACGSGRNAISIKQACIKELNFYGSDISRIAVADFEKLHGHGKAFVSDFTKPLAYSSKYDAILILGGVHHMVGDLEMLFQNIKNLLVPNGLLIFVEPNRLFLNKVRKFWYEKDKYFDAEDEEAINHDELYSKFGKSFEVLELTYIGGPGFFLVLQSIILRIPKTIKKIIARPVTFFDRHYGMYAPANLLPAFVAVWKFSSVNEQE